MTTATLKPLPAVPTVALVTAEEYAALPDDGRLTELVRGVVIEMPSPKPTHGYYCLNIGSIVREYVRARDLGRVVSNDSGVVTERGPDSVRGPDVAYYSFAVVPRGPLPDTYWPAPELVFEVRSPSDRWAEVHAKAAEYLLGGVKVVAVLDPPTQTLHVYRPDEVLVRLTLDDELTLPELFPDFRVPVRQLFE